MPKLSEEALLWKRLGRRTSDAVERYGLIAEGDRILIALSGGKDSLALAELLGRRMRIFNPRFSLVAAHISLENIPYRSDLAYLEAHVAQYGIPFVHHRTSFDPAGDRRKSPCFLCSWNRRKALFEIAKTHGCNKIALGHHQDDVLQTLLMNMTFQGAFSTMPPKLAMTKFAMTLIRPLCLVPESELTALASWRNYRKQEKKCPYESASHRPDMRRLLAELEHLNPHARSNLWASMTNVQEEYLPAEKPLEPSL